VALLLLLLFALLLPLLGLEMTSSLATEDARFLLTGVFLPFFFYPHLFLAWPKLGLLFSLLRCFRAFPPLLGLISPETKNSA
jgi:hypothetical protein